MQIKNKVLEQYIDYLFKYETVLDGFHLVLKFDNGYGISLLNNCNSYGQEIARIFFIDSEEYDVSAYVLGDLTNSQVFEEIEKIKQMEVE